MASNTTKPVILIIHGAWMPATSWDSFRAHVKQFGYESVCPQQPSANDRSPADKRATLTDDAKIIKDAALELIAQKRQIVVLAHSYGGAVACSALTDDLFAAGPDAPGILHVVWLATWIPQEGKTIGDILAKHGMQSAVDLDFREDGTSIPKNAEVGIFGDLNDMDPERAAKLAETMLPQNWATTMCPVTETPWKHPGTYVVCANDQAIMAPLQRAMLGDVEEAGGKLEVVELATDHCPFLTKPQVVLDFIDKASVGYAKAG